MTQIFIEARYEKTSEYVFLNTIIKELGFSEAQYKIICVGGNSNLIKAANKFKENTIEGGKNLIIFDADTPARGMDFRLPCNASTRNCKAMECRLTESFFSQTMQTMAFLKIYWKN